MSLRALLAIGLIAALAACSAPSTPGNAALGGGQPGAAAAPPANGAAAAAARSPCDTGATCTGPLLVRAERMILTPASGEDNTTVSAVLSLANRSGEEVRVILVDIDAVVTLENGATVSTNTFGWTGIQGCRGRTGQQCLDATPDQFLTLRPGDSPVQLTATLGSTVPDALRTTLRGVTKASMTFTLFVTGPGGRRQVQVSVADVPVTNQIPR